MEKVAFKSGANRGISFETSKKLAEKGIKVNSGHPGWVKTKLGSPNPPMEEIDSYETSLYLATLDKDGPRGGLFHKEETLPW